MPGLNFDLAPPAKTVDGLLAVPIDIQSITASLIFDGSTSKANGEATIQFTTGLQAGNPVFDLRQTITGASLDGSSLPVAKLAHHDFGGGENTQMRILESVLPAKTTHTLHLTYELSAPIGSSATISGTVPGWTAGPRLVWRSAFSDLNPARYLELWIPANLIFDQFQLTVEISIQHTTIQHTLITNGSVTDIGLNHWLVSFPDYWTALSHLFELRPSEALTSLTGNVTLPVSGTNVNIEVWKLTTSSIDLAPALANLQKWLPENESNIGPYLHGSRFIAILRENVDMEYAGGTTCEPDPIILRHETHHSWWGRGLTPASQPDGWWDEAWTTYYDSGASGSMPFDFTSPPVKLSPRNPWVRGTSDKAYDAGERFFDGVAAEIGGPGVLNALMRAFYVERYDRPATTMDIESFLVSKTGHTQLVGAFQRFVYGFENSSPNLWLMDEPGHTGTEDWKGRFWDSPDLWIRRDDDGVEAHEEPLPGQDNFFYARVRNLSGSGIANHFLVTFNVKGFAGTEFVYPNDFLPSITAAAGFELAAGDSRVVSARWPAALVPPAGSYRCIVAAVLSQGDYPSDGLQVWQQNNLAQKNITVAQLGSGEFMIVPFVVANADPQSDGSFLLEFIPTSAPAGISASLLEPAADPRLFANDRARREDLLDCGGRATMSDGYNMQPWTSRNPRSIIAERFTEARRTTFEDGIELRRSCLLAPFSWALRGLRGKRSRRGLQLPVQVRHKEQRLLGLAITVPPSARPGETILVDLVKRDTSTNQILGGLAVQINVADNL